MSFVPVFLGLRQCVRNTEGLTVFVGVTNGNDT